MLIFELNLNDNLNGNMQCAFILFLLLLLYFSCNLSAYIQFDLCVCVDFSLFSYLLRQYECTN